MKRFEVGTRVVEPTYGLGSIVAVEDAYLRVQFDERTVSRSSSRASPGWSLPARQNRLGPGSHDASERPPRRPLRERRPDLTPT